MTDYVVPIAVEVQDGADIDLILCSIAEHRGVVSASALGPAIHRRGACVWRAVAARFEGLTIRRERGH